MKKVLALVLALCLALPMMASAVELTDIYPISDEKIELRIFLREDTTCEDYATNKELVWAENLTNVHVTLETASGTDMETKYNLSVASGDYPDIYMCQPSLADQMQLAEDGVIIPLEDLIDNETVFMKAYLDEHPEVREAITAPDGHIYTCFSILYNFSQCQYTRAWVYKPWLEAYTAATGNGSPATTDEFRAMLEYFRDNDMNGNGDNTDEVPLSGNYQYWYQGGDPTYFLLNAFCFVPLTQRKQSAFTYVNDEGQVCTDVTTDAYREGLKYVHSLYADKLLAEEVFTQDLNQYRATTSVLRDKVTVGAAGAPYPMRLLTLNENPDNVAFADYVPVTPLTGPEGHCGIPTDDESIVNFFGQITTACENPVAAIKWLDLWLSEEGSQWTNRYGLEGDTWEWTDAPSVGGSDKSYKITFMQTGKQNQYLMRGSNFLYLCTEAEYADQSVESVLTNSNGYMYYMSEPYRNAAVKTNIPYNVKCDDNDIYVEYTELASLFVDYVSNMTTQFVAGTLDVNDDAVWNNYLTELNNMGLERYLEVARLYYFGK